MAIRRRINKKITKSICMSERYWELLKLLTKNGEMSNGDAVRDCLIATHFLNGYLCVDKEFTVKFWDYFNEAKRIDEQTVFDVEKSKEPFSFQSESFPKHPYEGQEWYYKEGEADE